MQLYPQPDGFSFQLSGPAFALIAQESEIARIDAVLTAPVAIGDALRIVGSVIIRDEAPIEIYHGETLVATMENVGVFDFTHIADNDSMQLRIQSTSPTAWAMHLLGGLSVTRA